MRKFKKLGGYLKQILVSTLGTWFYSVSRLPVGTHLEYFLKYRVNLPINTVVDVGANVGKFSVSLFRHFPKSQFYCIEPFSQTFKVLQRNIPYPNFIFSKVALGEKNESITIKVNPANQSDTNSLRNLTLEADQENSELIEVITLDEFILQNQLNRIDFLKIDTEGFDLQVLKGGIQNLNEGRIKLILVECGLDPSNKYHVYFQELSSFLFSANFTLVGFFQTDIRKISKRHHFSNALFAHESVLDQIG